MRPRRLLAAFLLLASAALLLAACGSSSSTAEQRTPTAAPLVGENDPVLSTKPSPKADPVSDHGQATRGRPPQFGTDNDEVSVSGGKPLDPCALVTRREAQAIIGRLAGRQTVPLGPSCVYTSGARTAVTLSVQSATVPTAARSSHRTIRLTVQGRAAYCVNATKLAVLVPLGGGRVLSVTAPCPIAARFAAAALPRIPA